jgi:hypothetical protein
VKKTTGYYPRPSVDTRGRAALGQAGGVLLTSTVQAAALDAGLSAALAPWRPANAVHDPAKVLLDLTIEHQLWPVVNDEQLRPQQPRDSESDIPAMDPVGRDTGVHESLSGPIGVGLDRAPLHNECPQRRVQEGSLVPSARRPACTSHLNGAHRVFARGVPVGDRGRRDDVAHRNLRVDARRCRGDSRSDPLPARGLPA